MVFLDCWIEAQCCICLSWNGISEGVTLSLLCSYGPQGDDHRQDTSFHSSYSTYWPVSHFELISTY